MAAARARARARMCQRLVLLSALAACARGWVLLDVSGRTPGHTIYGLTPAAAEAVNRPSAFDEGGLGTRRIVLKVCARARANLGWPASPARAQPLGGVTAMISAWPNDDLIAVGGLCALLCELLDTVGPLGTPAGAGYTRAYEAEGAWCHEAPAGARGSGAADIASTGTGAAMHNYFFDTPGSWGDGVDLTGYHYSVAVYGGAGAGAGHHWCTCLDGVVVREPRARARARVISVAPQEKPRAAATRGCVLLGSSRSADPGCESSGTRLLPPQDAFGAALFTRNGSAVRLAMLNSRRLLLSGLEPLPADVPRNTLPGECVCKPGFVGPNCECVRACARARARASPHARARARSIERPTCARTAACPFRNMCLEPSSACAACVPGWSGPACEAPQCDESAEPWGGARCQGGHCASDTDALACECADADDADPRTRCATPLSVARGSLGDCFAPHARRVGDFFAVEVRARTPPPPRADTPRAARAAVACRH